jgi:hypothetical protein
VIRSVATSNFPSAGSLRVRTVVNRTDCGTTAVPKMLWIHQQISSERYRHLDTSIGVLTLQFFGCVEGTMPQRFGSRAVWECYRRAAEARKLAATTDDPAQKQDLLAVAQGWLALARHGELEQVSDDELKKALDC